MRADPWVTPWRCSLCHRNHPGPCGCPCHFPAQVRAAARAALAAAALAVTLLALAACRPASGSPNCPPGQWYADKPGTGWICASAPPIVYTPGRTFAPASPAEVKP